MLLADLAYCRSGDKGDICNVGLMAKSPDLYPALLAAVTPERVKDHFGDMVRGEVTVYELPNLHAVNVVMRGALGGGATRTVRLDQTGKSMSTALLRMAVPTEV
jgi:hypothetical protein